MLKYCKDRWNKYKDRLEEALRENGSCLNSCAYIDLVEFVVEYILNSDAADEDRYNKNNITAINDGDYQGTLLFVIPKDCYQPSENEYLLTFASYGSCSCCDTLMSIQSGCYGNSKLTEEQVKGFMSLCKDLVCNIVKPYNYGWRSEEKYTEIAR